MDSANTEVTKILLVEDNPGDARLIQIILEETEDLRFEIAHAEQLDKAKQHLSDEHFDVILLDLSLPDCFGLDTLRKIRTKATNSPIVILTGNDDEQVAISAVQEGAQDYLVKGRVENDVLVRSIRYAIERNRILAELEEARRMERHMAYHDPLTGLPNRLLFHDRLTQNISYAQRQGKIIAIMFLDLDRFKVINDTLGHSVGDLLLKDASSRLTNCIRKSDTVARWGGDEFTIILGYMTTQAHAAKVAQKIQDDLARAFHLEGHEIFITSSIGISLFPDHGSNIDDLVKNADIAMYYAKGIGRNNHQFFLPFMNDADKALARMELENHLRVALEQNQLFVHYQPQVDIETHQIVGLEALIRWRHPTLGLISPGVFIPIAEETGLIIPIGEWVLHTACRQNFEWQKAGFSPIRIAVNLSARQFQQPKLLEIINDVLNETGLDPNFLEVEITESVVMEDVEGAIEVLNALRSEGIHVSIDDFGTGFSSLSYLKRFPANKLKIDKSFIQSLATDPYDAAIAQAIIVMAHSLNQKAIAEGVETEEQMELLRRLGCDEIQGYLFSPPVSSEEMTKMFAERVTEKG